MAATGSINDGTGGMNGGRDSEDGSEGGGEGGCKGGCEGDDHRGGAVSAAPSLISTGWIIGLLDCRIREQMTYPFFLFPQCSDPLYHLL